MKRSSGLRNMTVGSPAAHLFAFALPLLCGSFLQQLYNMVDAWVVGRHVGDAALAAVGIGSPVLFMFSSLFMGLSSGGTVVIAQFYGAGELKRVRDAIDTVYTTFMTSIIPITLAALALVKPILFLLRVKPGAYDEAWLYLTVVCAGLIGNIGYNLNAGILAGLGNTRTTLLFLCVSSVMNILLDLIFVMVCGWGVFGVAFATILSQAVSWLFGLFYINRRYPEIAIRPFCHRFDRGLFKEIMSVGLPAGIQMSLVAFGSMAVMSKVNTFGEEFTAGYNVGVRLDQLAFLPIQSLASASTAFVGQNIGAQRPDRARRGIRIVVSSAVIWALSMAALLIAFSPVFVGHFSQTPAVIYGGTVYLRGIMPTYVLFAILFSLNNSMRGAGDGLFPMVNAILSLILLRLPAVYFFANHFGPEVMFWGYGVGWALGCFLSCRHYLTGKWLKKGSIAGKDPTVSRENP